MATAATERPARRSLSGRAVTVVVLALGLGLGALASWFLVGARPEPGAFVDAVVTPDGALAIRHEHASARGFFELWRVDDGRLRRVWSGMVPRYAGKPGVIAAAATRAVATVRVIRGGRPHLFAFDLVRGAKIASFELDPSGPADPAVWSLPTVATAGAEAHTIEVVGTGGGGSALIAVDLGRRSLVWRRTLPWTPTQVWLVGDRVGAASATDSAGFDLASGAPGPTPPPPPPGLGDGLTYEPTTRTLRAAGGQTFALPADAIEPRPYHVGHGLIWIVTPAGLVPLASRDLSPAMAP